MHWRQVGHFRMTFGSTLYLVLPIWRGANSEAVGRQFNYFVECKRYSCPLNVMGVKTVMIATYCNTLRLFTASKKKHFFLCMNWRLKKDNTAYVTHLPFCIPHQVPEKTAFMLVTFVCSARNFAKRWSRNCQAFGRVDTSAWADSPYC